MGRTNEKIELSDFAVFTDRLMTSNVIEVSSQEALKEFAKKQNVRRIEMHYQFGNNLLLTWRAKQDFVLYDISGDRKGENQNPDDPNQYVFEYAVDDGGAVFVHFFPVEGASCKPEGPEEEKAYRAFANVLTLHAARETLLEGVEIAALHNYMTGLRNSGGFSVEIEKHIKAGDISDYDALYLNINGFGLVNSDFGSQEANEIIKRYAHKLEQQLGEDEVLSHFGGDNFVILIRREHTLNFLENVRIVPVYGMIDGKSMNLNLNARVGVLPIRDKNANTGDIVGGCSMALSIARSRKLDRFVLDDITMNRVLHQKIIARNFADALEHGRIQAYYQPKVDTNTGNIIGTEALTRWTTREGKLLSPAEYVPILEENGHIVDLDLYMLQCVCRDIAHYSRHGEPIVPASVNFSRRDFSGRGRSPRILADEILNIIQDSGIPLSSIIIEVTETTEANEAEDLKEFLAALREAGVRTSVDDFGTGYSSLGLLRDMPVDEIKIDRSFINHEKFTVKDEIIIRSIIDMARELKIDVITEGVENEIQIEFLRKLGCTRVQGYYYDKPLPKEQFEARLKRKGYQKISVS